MPSSAIKTADDVVMAVHAARERFQKLIRWQLKLTALCWILLIVALVADFMGYPKAAVITLALLGSACGLSSWFVGRMAKKISDKAAALKNAIARVKPSADLTNTRKGKSIPLTIGFANLSGDDLMDIAVKDAATLSGLFSNSRIVPEHQIPTANVLFVYAHLNNDGTIRGSTPLTIRQIAEATKAGIVVLASPNSAESIKNAVALPGEKTSNIVFTVDRNGNGFGKFFRKLFESMGSGKDMLSAWVEIAPQNPSAIPSYVPQTMLLAEGGKIAFPS